MKKIPLGFLIFFILVLIASLIISHFLDNPIFVVAQVISFGFIFIFGIFTLYAFFWEKMDIDEDEEAEYAIETMEYLYLLSEERYIECKDNIPGVNCCWWLQTKGEEESKLDSMIRPNRPETVKMVIGSGSVFKDGNPVTMPCGVRPVMPVSKKWHKIGERITRYGYTWVVFDFGYAISEVPIAFRRFDEESSDYNRSEIKQFLWNWVQERR